MIEIKRLTAEDALTLRKGVFSEKQLEALEANPFAYSVFIDGALKMCAGITPYWEGRGEAWAIFGKTSRREFLALHNAGKKILGMCSLKRIEAAVDVDFTAGHRWVQALGFELEAARLKAFLPNGHDVSLYARVNHG
jgi:hypothetical protein